MNFKGIYYSLTFRLALAIGLTAALTYLALAEEWGWFLFLGVGWLATLRGISLLFKRNAQKVAFMFDAIDNSDYAFKYATRGRSSNDKLVSESLNRITQILFQAKAEAIQKEKYYELIMNQVNTGIIVEDDKGNIFQTNNEALRLLGLTVFTHARQLGRIDENLERLISDVRPGETTFVFLSFYLILLIDRELYLTFECFVYRFCKEKINKRRFFLTAILTASLFCR